MATTATLTVKMEVEYDLDNDCLRYIADALEELRDKANEYGSVESMKVTTNVPLSFDIE